MSPELPDRFQIYQFKVDLILGKGGSGTVYRGINPETGQVVAIKLFREDFFSSRFHVRDLARSVKKFKEFDHPNVVKIFDFISGKEGSCLIQEYVDGPDMRWYLEQRPWNLHERLVICAQICNGLQYIHDQGFLHHDVKPGNVLFTRKGQVKLSDFSLRRAHFFDFITGGLKEHVTPMFVAPEIINKQKATPQSDIYSLGITMYLMFAEKPPFEADTLQKLYFCHLNVVPPHPSDINSKCPRPLGDVIMQMIEKDPKKRFENCDQLRIRLADMGRSRI
ncbi:MAG TPA: serine/threonine-protein kinase [Candidatus Hydrogenedentes bacterium]|nr:serine/threonine-protein kinase [Candidatus Hydrogenedentota bacterium]HOL75607.1 serine/threonine-protein kinase [Candidatus Hydrogenedentota bacterium]HPO84400.1 serine/threonine-protein kinase [Candidatus Hydrogenedentota bacterium]